MINVTGLSLKFLMQIHKNAGGSDDILVSFEYVFEFIHEQDAALKRLAKESIVECLVHDRAAMAY